MNQLNKNDVFILCGGLGSRLKTVVGDSQKTMSVFDGEPFLNIILKDLRNQGFLNIVLGTGYQSDQVEGYYLKNNLGLNIKFSKEISPLGTGGAIKNARDKINTDIFFVLNGDSYCEIDYQAFLKFHLKFNGCASLAVSRLDEKKDFGTIIVDENKKILAFKEKINDSELKVASNSVYVNAGVYCFSRSVFDSMPKEERFSVEQDLFPKLIDQRMYAFEVDTKFIDIGTPQRFSAAKEIFKKDTGK